MTRTFKALGRDWSMDDHATLLVIVPDGETEAHVFTGGKLIGKRSDLDGEWLNGTMLSAEKYARDAAIVRAAENAGVSYRHSMVMWDTPKTSKYTHVEIHIATLADRTIIHRCKYSGAGDRTQVKHIALPGARYIARTRLVGPEQSTDWSYWNRLVEVADQDALSPPWLQPFVFDEATGEVSMSVAKVRAAYEEDIATATGPASATVSRIDTLETRVNKDAVSSATSPLDKQPIDIDQLNKDLAERMDWIGASVRKLRDELGRISIAVSTPWAATTISMGKVTVCVDPIVMDAANATLKGYAEGLADGLKMAIEVFTEETAEGDNQPSPCEKRADWSIRDRKHNPTVEIKPGTLAFSDEPKPDPRLAPLEKFDDPELEARFDKIEAALAAFDRSFNRRVNEAMRENQRRNAA